MKECPLKRDHFKKKRVFPTIHFSGAICAMLVFGGDVYHPFWVKITGMIGHFSRFLRHREVFHTEGKWMLERPGSESLCGCCPGKTKRGEKKNGPFFSEDQKQCKKNDGTYYIQYFGGPSVPPIIELWMLVNFLFSQSASNLTYRVF